MRFQTIIEVGILHYPEELGFLFHKDIEQIQKPFGVACGIFGKERVAKFVEKTILKITQGRSYVIRALLLSVADNPNIEADGLYCLLRSDPTSLIPATL